MRQSQEVLTMSGKRDGQRETVYIQIRSRVKLLSVCSWSALFSVDQIFLNKNNTIWSAVDKSVRAKNP